MRRAWFAQVQTPNNDNGRSNCNRMIQHLQRFGINVDEGFPEADEDGKYPNDDDAGTDTNSPDEIDEMITDEDVDPDTDEPDDDEEDQ
jgi:hypothetical protein